MAVLEINLYATVLQVDLQQFASLNVAVLEIKLYATVLQVDLQQFSNSTMLCKVVKHFMQ